MTESSQGAKKLPKAPPAESSPSDGKTTPLVPAYTSLHRLVAVRLSRRSVRVLTIASVLSLTACGNEHGQSNVDQHQPEEKLLHVYNWADYIGRDTIADFEARTGIKVVYDTYDAVEILETKLLTGDTGYDVVFPNQTVLARLGRIGVLRKLDKSRLPNLHNLDPEIMGRIAVNDPGNEHAISYMWGTVGIGFNPKMVLKVLGTDSLDSWGAVFDPVVASKLQKCGITILDAPDDTFQAAAIYLGIDPNTEEPSKLDAVESLIKKIRPYVRNFDTTQHLNALASGDICVSLSWTNLILQARARGAESNPPVELKYVIPKEGTLVWLDTVAIPADAPHPENAHLFLNFLMDPKVIASISNYIGNANGNSASLPLVDAALRDDSSVYPDATTWDRLHVSRPRSPEFSRALNRAWTRIKTGQ